MYISKLLSRSNFNECFPQMVKTSFNMEIWWSGTHRVEVHLPNSFDHETCGVCGNFNYDPADDLVIGPKCVGQDQPGSLVSNDNEDVKFYFIHM